MGSTKEELLKKLNRAIPKPRTVSIDLGGLDASQAQTTEGLDLQESGSGVDVQGYSIVRIEIVHSGLDNNDGDIQLQDKVNDRFSAGRWDDINGLNTNLANSVGTTDSEAIRDAVNAGDEVRISYTPNNVTAGTLDYMIVSMYSY